MSNILIGTSGYDYPEWKNVFYPSNLKRPDFLPYYSTIFNTLELNYSFYSMPTLKQMISFYDRTQGKIQFTLKANSSLTHYITPTWKDNVKLFQNASSYLLEKNSLANILFQFPQSFHYTNQNRVYLANLLQEFSVFPSVIEFRHNSWYKNSVFQGLQQYNSSLVFCDMPRISNLPQSITNFEQIDVNFNTFYLRLHGRNAENWYDQSTNNAARYTYSYSDDELQSLLPIIKKASNKSKLKQIFFNNHPNGAAPKNAISLKGLLQ